MINRLNPRLFLFLLPVSCFVSGSLSLGLQDTHLPNTTIFNYTQYNNKTTVQQTTTITQEQSSPAPTFGQNTSKTSRPLQETNVERDASTLSSLLGGNKTNATNTASSVRTTGHMVLDEPSTGITTKPVAITVTEIKTTLNHQPQNTQKTATKVCTIAEPKEENLVGRCLLAIGSLAAITTIFIMTTIILATKLAGSRHKHRTSLLLETEMVCISTLMNDSDHPVPMPRRLKSNGALIPITEDEDGDDLTLNSFLHDTDGVV
ncbi:P-selectin glycoprotein ligand 1 [Bagarius yarrelli]|uniref:P-selectin glycoprotein ligand 1 n=1 Tax=Bagarius yarrelli TaxID=175774 RepID=A0A556V6K5_BAGYA|nr:P-selectin glycoprotein ligand 1 [Bagarius yarrelli]